MAAPDTQQQLICCVKCSLHTVLKNAINGPEFQQFVLFNTVDAVWCMSAKITSVHANL